MANPPTQGTETFRLKAEIIGDWIAREWMPRFPDSDRVTVWADSEVVHEDALINFDRQFALPNGYHFVSADRMLCNITPNLNQYDYRAVITARTGAFMYRFTAPDAPDMPDVEAIVVSAATDESGWMTAMANLPRAFLPIWYAFAKEVYRLALAVDPSDRVKVVGGRDDSFELTVDWDDIILPESLKNEILTDVKGFFNKGVAVYQRLKLKPFRKLLLAGVPGTGKTMMCAALAKWAIEQGYLVVYVSSSQRWRRGDGDGASFEKIDHALNIAAKSDVPTLLIVEELDIYLRPEHKALILNVLDGSESAINEKGTLLLATTNYPEAIDERVLKRPGRLDRVFIIPEARLHEDAEKLLRTYLGDLWNDTHLALVPKLIGYPGAFIREVAIYALTQLAYVDGKMLTLDLLVESYKRLKEQIDAGDDFLKRRNEVGFTSKKSVSLLGLATSNNGDYD